MNTVPQIVQAIDGALARGEDVVLATVVKVENSAYRRPGARMLVCADGQHAGMVSGGCLESEIVRKAWWLTSAGAPVVCRYDTGAGADAEWAFGLGCNGAINILLEHVDKHSPQLHWLRQVAELRRPAACAVVIARSGVSSVDVGQRLFVTADGKQMGELPDRNLQNRVFADLAQALVNGSSRQQAYFVDGGEVEFFLEVIVPPPQLVIFGAGLDAVPLAQMAHGLGWHVTVADGRSHFARAERFPEADRVIVLDLADPHEAWSACEITRQSVVVVMTHSYEQDRLLLEQLLEVPPRYIGQLGPRSRTERMLDELGARGKARTLVDAGVLHYPVGLDIGADNPQEVALAILAEIKAELADRGGGMLSHCVGAIHSPMVREATS